MDIKQTILNSLQNGTTYFVLNLKRVYFLNSAGLSLLLVAFRVVNENGGQIAICDLTAQAKKVIELTKLLYNFWIFKTEEEALKSFRLLKEKSPWLK